MTKDKTSIAAHDAAHTLDLTDVLQVISIFGGLRPLATALGVPASTVQGWKERGAIPSGRHEEVRAAYIRHRQESDIPVDHAIDAAAGMRDAIPPQADEKTRSYQPPRSKSVSPSASGLSAGGSNLILSLILFTLAILVGVVGYLVFLSQVQRPSATVLALQTQVQDVLTRQSDAQDALAQRLDALDAANAQTQTTLAGVEAELNDSSTLDMALENLSEDLTARLVLQLDSALTNISDDFDAQARELTTTSEQQDSTIVELTRSQTALFEVLSQDLLAKMDMIVANMDASITEQVARLQQQAEMAQVEAMEQQRIATEQQRLAEESAARAAEAEAQAQAAVATAEGIVGAGFDQLLTLMQLRIALSVPQQSLEAGYAALGAVAETDAELSLAMSALDQVVAETDYLTQGLPAPTMLIEEVDRLIEVDRQALRSGTFGFARIPSADNLDTNQGRLAASRAAIADGAYGDSLMYVNALDAIAGQQSGELMAALRAHVAATDAANALDRWLNVHLTFD